MEGDADAAAAPSRARENNEARRVRGRVDDEKWPPGLHRLRDNFRLIQCLSIRRYRAVIDYGERVPAPPIRDA